MSRIGMKEQEPIFHPWINKAIEKAQTRVEERNYEIRKHLLDYDDVLNEQRKFIYSQRDAILLDADLLDRVESATEDMVADIIETFRAGGEDPITAAGELLDSLQEQFLFTPDISAGDIIKMKGDSLEESLLRELKTGIETKKEQIGEENLNAFIRYEYLRNIDSRWQDHLESLEALREAVYLRSYGQKNPLLEYKLEGFQIFDALIQSIRTSIASKIHKVKIQKREREPKRNELPQPAMASHRALDQFSGSGKAPSAPQRESEPAKVQIQRVQPKVGRNDPCPCGSGKKYKHCHGS